jgi:hypothetical protein
MAIPVVKLRDCRAMFALGPAMIQRTLHNLTNLSELAQVQSVSVYLRLGEFVKEKNACTDFDVQALYHVC